MCERKDELIGIITVRLNTCSDTQNFQAILKELAKAAQHEPKAYSIRLLKSDQVENDWAIHLNYSVAEKEGKSSLAANFAEALHSVGLVHQELWRSCDLSDL